MKLKNALFGRSLFAAATLTLSVTVSQAATLYWDGTSTTADADGGAGAWNTGTNWDSAATGGADTAWSDGSDASFAGVGGAVTVTGTVSTPSISIGTTNASAYTISGGNITLTGTPTITNTTAATISSVLGGSVGMTKAGAGVLTLSGTHGYTGGTIVNAGTLALTTGGATGTIKGAVTVNSGGTLNASAADCLGYTAGSQVEPLNVAGGIVNNTTNGNQGYRTNFNLTGATVNSSGGGAFNFTTAFGITNNASATTTAFNAPISLRDNNNMGIAVATGTTASGVDLQIAGVISGGGGAITKTGTGLLYLTGANTFTGNTSVSAGTLRLGNTLALQSSTLATGTVIFDQSVASHAFTLGGLSTTTNLTLADNATTPNAVALSVGNNNAATSSSAILSGAGSLIKVGTGNTTLTGLSTFSGGTTVNAGTLTLGSGGGVGTLRSAITVNSGATLALTAVNATGYTAGSRVETLNINGGTLNNTANGDNGWAITYNLTGGTMQSNGGTASTTAGPLFTLGKETTGSICAINSLASATTSTVAGRLHIRENNASNLAPFDVADGLATTDLLVSAAITQDGTTGYGISKAGAGLMNLTGPCVYTGNTVVNGGVLQLGRTGTLGNSTVVVNNTGTFRVIPAGATLKAITANNGSTLSMPVGTGITTNLTGALTLTNGAAISVSPALGNVGLGTYDLITAASITGTGTPTLASSGAFGSSRVTGSVAVNGNKLQLTLTGLGANLVWNNASAAGNVAGTWDLNNLLNFNNGGSNDVFKSFDSVTFDDTIAGTKAITLSGALAPALMTINSASTYTFNSATLNSGALVGSGSLVKSGSGTATFGTNMGYTMNGDITVSGGTLDLSSKSFNAGKITLNGGALNNATINATGLDLQSGSTSATITSAAAWTKTTAGAVTLTANNALSGAGTVSAGTLNLGTTVSPYGTTGNLGSGPVSIAAGATIAAYRANIQITVPNSFSGAGNLVFVGGNTGAAGIASDYNLSGDNSGFSGPITVTGARVYSSANNLGTGTATNGLNGAFLLAGGGTYPNAFFLSGNGWGETLGVAGALRYDKGSTTTGTITLTGNTRIGAHGNTGNIAGPIVESGGARNLELGGTSSLSTFNISSASTYTGTTTLTLASVNLTGSLGATAVSVGVGSSIGGTGTIGTSSNASLTFVTGATNLNANIANNGLTVNGSVSLLGTTTVNLATGGIANPSGVITLLNYNSISGSTTNLVLANAANYRQAVFNVGATKITLDIGAKSITWNGTSGGQWTIGGSNRWNTTGSGETDVYFQGDNVTFNDTGVATAITLTGVMAPNSVVVDNSVNNYTLTESGTGYISGNTSLVKSGSANLTLTGAANTYTGGTVVNGGTLFLGTGGGAGTIRGALTINSGATVTTTAGDALGYTVGTQVNPLTINNGGTFNNNTNANEGFTTNVIMTGASLTSTGTGPFNFTNGYGITTIASATTSVISSRIDIRDTNNLNLAVAAGTTPSGIDASSSGVISGYALTKSGAGTLQLSAANTYTAGTTVAGGKLLVDNTTGSGTGTGAVAVNNGATLSLTGTITGAVTVNNGGALTGTGTASGAVAAAGTLAPGNGTTGTLTTGATTLTGTLATEVNGGSGDKLMVNGNLTLTGATLSISVLGGGFSGTYVIAEYTGTLTGTFATVPAGYTVTYNAGVGNKQILLTQSPFGAWALANGLTAGNNGPSDDPDHDGIPNLLEYVLTSQPLYPSLLELPGQSLDGDNLTFYFTRNKQSKQDTPLKVQWGTNLTSWTDIVVPDHENLEVQVNESNPSYDLITVTIPRSNAVNGKLFVRLKATQP
ncbi:autotransporter-associated beta strand repeat-containing protein [Luteolibacter sp. LG18]|uniref:beta strand repeat-containing protein n=1 Tax=Luteolibacter sp. LG18 TaxID=2819286 RepID=UPI002B31B706|nr:hypothetical protein llg_01970 [Luteolibacter sp. LG18]